MQKWHLGLPSISILDFLARNMHRHITWGIISKHRAFRISPSV